ncbi:hypothetical protein KJK34_07070 [Flavobacterium sp. D11R37]|uniref:lipase family protein n=1 Tax=Flavobacterium coralii TaxID=2838017 RepID=UPI001CA69E9B|nr:hypothetical protein [Flavobacterium coralii]MBY8962510.1 hypothetical protein [Flavobacterium coralii]
MNEFQQTFVCSIASNMAQELINQPVDTSSALSPIEQATALMEKQMNDTLPGFFQKMGIDAPEAVWGPSVYIDAEKDFSLNTQNNTYTATATNTMVVFKTGANNYTLAIAGTKATSVFDAVTEDGSVLITKKWPYGIPQGMNPKISNGTSIGVGILLTQMTDPVQGNNIAGYLKSIDNATNVITITGHSLGGALAPALALALFGSASNLGYNFSQKAQVFATAGPDVGNKDYYSYYSSSFKPTGATNGVSWQQYNQKIWNSLDVVPQAWANLSVINTIYQSNGLNTPDYVKCIIRVASAALIFDNYYSMDPDKKGQFTAKYVTPSDTPGYDCGTCAANLPTGLCDFVAEMLYQHIAAYSVEFGIPVLPSAIKPCSTATELYAKKICGCGIIK